MRHYGTFNLHVLITAKYQGQALIPLWQRPAGPVFIPSTVDDHKADRPIIPGLDKYTFREGRTYIDFHTPRTLYFSPYVLHEPGCSKRLLLPVSYTPDQLVLEAACLQVWNAGMQATIKCVPLENIEMIRYISRYLHLLSHMFQEIQSLAHNSCITNQISLNASVNTIPVITPYGLEQSLSARSSTSSIRPVLTS